MVRAKLFVPAGAPVQLKPGDVFCPEQPKLLNTCAAPIMALLATSLLVSLKVVCPRTEVTARTSEESVMARRIVA